MADELTSDYTEKIKAETETIRLKLEEVYALAVERGLMAAESDNNDDRHLIVLSEQLMGRREWIEFARPWMHAYNNRAGAYMCGAGAHFDEYRWCRRCSAADRGEGWDYEAEINDYTLAIEDYMNTVRLQWGCHPGINSCGDAFIGGVREYLSTRHSGVRPQRILSKGAAAVRGQKNSAGALCYDYVNCDDHDTPKFLRRNYQTDIAITLQSAYLCKAEACFDARQYECAVEEYTKLINLSLEDHPCCAWVYPAVYIDRAQALFCLGRNDEAAADFKDALRVDPENEEATAGLR